MDTSCVVLFVFSIPSTCTFQIAIAMTWLDHMHAPTRSCPFSHLLVPLGTAASFFYTLICDFWLKHALGDIGVTLAVL